MAQISTPYEQISTVFEISSFLADLDAMVPLESFAESKLVPKNEWGLHLKGRGGQGGYTVDALGEGPYQSIRCTYCDCVGEVVSCSTCVNHACIGKCIPISERGNKAFQCLACLDGKSIPYQDNVPRNRATWRRDGRWNDCLTHTFYVSSGDRSKTKPVYVASAIAAAEGAFKDKPAENRLTVLTSEMREDRSAEDETTLRAKTMRSSVEEFLSYQKRKRDSTWNYLAVVQTRCDSSGKFLIGPSDEALLIDRLLSRFTHKSLWYELTVTQGTKGMLLFPAPETHLISNSVTERLVNLVEKRRFTFIVVFSEFPERVASSTTSSLFNLCDQVFSRYPDTSEAVLTKIARIFGGVFAVAERASLLLTYNDTVSQKTKTCQLANGIWGARVNCLRPCSAELLVHSRNKNGGLKLLCASCGRKARNFIPMPEDTSLLVDSIFVRPFPPIIAVPKYVEDNFC
ncbi:hypothetical protein BC629DRAFT_1541318 [Irpex lacteus]|nr:hypothetical protein BC629DRAFT_1541318 [Irpex lacteus]